MTAHKHIQDPQDFQDDDYNEFERKLFSENTPVEDLEEICMTLAHLPTHRAQELLERFSQTERANDVEWCDCAKEEGEFHALSPTNEQEERDFLALKVMQEIEDEVIDMETKYDDLDITLMKQRIEQDAIRELIKNGELDADEAAGFEETNLQVAAEMESLKKRIAVREKTFAQIKRSITTERYQNVDMVQMRHFHF